MPWLESLSPREIVLGLERVQEVLARLDLDRPGLVVTVAGTNGKGSCVAMLEALLRQAGYRTGTYTSPHLSRYNERMRIDGRVATDAEVVESLAAVESAREGVPLTYFEFGTLAALLAFRRADTDAWILEVGMGGRLDAVNAIDPDASLITNIGLDHRAWLGDDREAIGREKAGVMRRGIVTVFGADDVPRSVLAHAEDVGADLRIAGRDFSLECSDAGCDWRGRHTAVAGLPLPPLAGPSQPGNVAAVLALVEALGIDQLLNAAAIGAAWREVRLPGRCQVVDGSRRWLLDVAHNTEAATALAGWLAGMPRSGGLVAVVGMLVDKDVEDFVDRLAPYVATWIAAATGGSRGNPAAPVAARIANRTGRPCLICENVPRALERALESSHSGDSILVTGSFYIVGPALDWLRERGELS